MSDRALAVIGTGKMGRAVESLAKERGWRVTTVIGHEENQSGSAITRQRLGDADVVIEFTVPNAAPANVLACVRNGYAVVSGTTGWNADLDRVRAEVRSANGALLWAPNFSVGVNLFFVMVARAARLIASAPMFDAALHETHHAAKKDAPSGTALALAQIMERELAHRVTTTSARVGHVPGTHEAIFDGPFEQIRLVHEARDRRVFADGALLAAGWLRGKTGIFTMNDVLGLQPGEGR
jgi:4-hydroxy-tetrahydrodipicolinate reductase